MKKYFIAACVVSTLTCYNANAKDGAYIGVNANLSQANYKYQGSTTPTQRRIDTDQKLGVGGYVGYKKSFGDVFVAPELFYDYLNSSTSNYYKMTTNKKMDTMEIRSRYGAKLNVGYNFTNSFSGFVNYGLSQLDHVDNYPTINTSDGKWKTAAIYGVGLGYGLNKDWCVRAEYNSQRFNVPFSATPGTSKVRLNVLQVGLAYHF